MGRSVLYLRVVLLALVVLVGFSSAPRVGAAGLEHVNAWATIHGTKPGVGCTVDVSVEVRSGGQPVVGVAVAIALFDDASNVISTDQQATGDDGIAWLTFDAGDAAGASDWLDVDVSDSYLGGMTIVPTAGGDCTGELRTLTTEADIAVPDTTATDQIGFAGGFPTHRQEHSLSCEYAAIEIATASFGSPISEDTSLSEVPAAVDPHYGFRGDIDGPYGSSDDYGVYAEALVPVLEANGYVGEVSYGADAGYLESQLDAGHPTLIWIATRGDTSFYDEDANGNRFKLVPYEHVVVAYAYDDSGVYISDPGTGGLNHLSWGWVLDAWSVLDGMALSIYPA